MKKHLFPLAMLLLVSSAGIAKECSSHEAYAAESVTDYLDSWPNVYLFYQQFGHCFDGAIAEGAEDAMQRLWADQWTTLPEMIQLMSRDPQFKAFVWERIGDETFPQDSFARFVQHATSACPESAKEFCQAVLAEVKRSAAQPGATSNRAAKPHGG